MPSCQLHIKGLVQGIGFRPFVYRIAEVTGITGTVSNGRDGVHITATGTAASLQQFTELITASPPPHAIIESITLTAIPEQHFSSFTIIQEATPAVADLILTPDFGLCEQCRKELHDASSRREGYVFTTCTQCGPRYSIITQLPYERIYTSMAGLTQCPVCSQEYEDPESRRYYSQTNSCPACTIPVHFYNKEGMEISADPLAVAGLTAAALQVGRIVAVKGIGGYLLLCDASNRVSIQLLRQRKNRPAKPFAVCYPDLEHATNDVLISEAEAAALKSAAAPVVLCRLRKDTIPSITTRLIAPGLERIGVLLPYTPLLELIAAAFGKPFIATSANLSGSPIVYTDTEAREHLMAYADFLLTSEREIVIPQDDSVEQFTDSGRKILLRRSRGYAPNYFPSPAWSHPEPVLAMGADLKSAFALTTPQRVYVSQYLGNLESYGAQEAFEHTLGHLMQLLGTRPAKIMSDLHPGYYSTLMAQKLAERLQIPHLQIQHHEAHFAAVLGEQSPELLQHEKILGAIWDGTGYGTDEQIWGGEFFLYEEGLMKRYTHLQYFPQVLGDKMSREPRLSALSLLPDSLTREKWIRPHFTDKEWSFFSKWMEQPQRLHTSSMGRFLDGIAVLLGLTPFNSFEGQASLQLQALAETAELPVETYSFQPGKGGVQFDTVILSILEELENGVEKNRIAAKLIRSLAQLILDTAQSSGATAIACSGGVFQNSLLCAWLEQLNTGFELLFHHHLSPNDECIAFGQLMWPLLNQQVIKDKPGTTKSTAVQKKTEHA